MNKEQYDKESDHDLLISLNVKQDLLAKQFSNHLQHHWGITIVALSAAFVGICGFVANLLIMLVKLGNIK